MSQRKPGKKSRKLKHSMASGGSSKAAKPPAEAAELLDVLAEKQLLPAELIDVARRDPPLCLGHYEIRAWLGEGGMGTVLRAFDTQLGREVALKLLADKREASVERFRREAQALARINHPNVVDVYGLHLEADVPFFTMELVQGQSLDRILAARGPKKEPEAWELLEQASAAMEHAEGQGILHRDLKPSNIMVESLGRDPRYRICDFGLAHLEELASSLTQDTRSRLVGSLPYMSPEQLRLQPLDARSDMYGLGVTLYELLTGKLPHRSLEGSDEEPEFLDVQALRPGISASLSQMVARLTRRRRDERPYSWSDVREFVRAARGGGVSSESGIVAAPAETEVETVPGGIYAVGHEGLESTIYERPRVQVELSSFSVDRALFKNRELLSLLAAFPKRPELRAWRKGEARRELEENPDQPLTGITWDEAAGIARLARARLPAQVEWEVFALQALQRGQAEEVEVFSCQEWCGDWVEFGFHKRIQTASAPPRDPRGRKPANRQHRVVVGRGRLSALPRRASYHLGFPPNSRRADLGFRLVNRGREGESG